MKQANAIIETSGSDGVCQTSLARKMGLTKLQSRTVLRNMVKTGIVATYMNDIGRQRLTKYVSKKFENGSTLSKQFKKEIHKIKELTKQIPTQNDDIEKNVISEKRDYTIISDQQRNIEKVIQSSTIDESNKNGNVKTREKLSTSTIRLQKAFYIVNRILYKYHLTKYPNRYKYTSSSVHSSKANATQTSESNINSGNVSSHISELSKTEEITAAYKNIKVDMTISRPICAKKPDGGVFGLMENVQNSERKSMTNITYRLLRRANMIIESVKENQVIDDMTKLMKVGKNIF